MPDGGQSLDFGVDLGSPVGIEYYDQPFKLNGKIKRVHVEYVK